MMHHIKRLFVGMAVLSASAFAVRADINVVTSIKPVHSLVAGVMKGVAEPRLIIEGAGSPHTFAIKPSQAAMLEKANLVFWIGPQLETFLEKPLKTLASGAKSVALIETKGLIKWDLREDSAFERHGHHDDDAHHHASESRHGHEKHAHRHGHRHAHDKHGHEKNGHAKKAEAGHHHGHHAFDSHVWLDPVNAKVFVGAIRKALSEVDPANGPVYERNAASIVALLDALVVEVAAELGPAQQKGFIVFHDAYQYFEKRFGLRASGSITVSPEVMPGAKRISELRSKVRKLGVACVFSEPQFEPKLVATVIEGTPAQSGVLDPLGAALKNDPNLYFTLIRNMAASFKACVGKAG